MLDVKMKSLIDNIRGKMDVKKYQDYIIGLMFYKFMSDSGRTKTKVEDWQNLQDVKRSFKEVEEDYPHILENIELDSRRFGATEGEKYKNIMLILDTLKDLNADAKAFGDMYEWLVAEFSSYDAKKSGEFYTPKEISHLLAKIVAGETVKSVYDPTCGTGSLLLEVKKELGDAAKLYGQEVNPTTYNLCRMGMILSGEDDAEIYNADTLKAETFGESKRFDAIVSNPPYSLKSWNTNELDSSHYYFKNGVLPPKSRGDMAFILHSFHHLAEDGKMAIILPHGVLFRQGAEEKIRTYLTPFIQSVIGLPENIFTNTQIATCVIVISKQPTDHITFIDASKQYEKRQGINIFTGTEKVIDVLQNQKEVERFSHIASMREIEENGYNLNIPRYVDTYEPEPPVDIKKLYTEIKEIDKNIGRLEQEILDDLRNMKGNTEESSEWLDFAKKIFEKE